MYERRASPLHATRAAVGAAWCLALTAAAGLIRHPLLLVTLLALVLAAAALAGVGRAVRRWLLWTLVFGLAVAFINALATREGLTVVWRFGELPGWGRVDLTAEGLAWGGVLGLRAATILCVARLYSAAVDPDELLRAFRRVSFHSAVTAAVATRLVPLLAEDGRRLALAARSRGVRPSRLALVRAITANALDRSLDMAATLELRGYGSARRAPRMPRPWSRHDLAFAASAVAIVVIAVCARSWAPFEPYPRIVIDLGTGVWVAGAVLALAVLAPFADRRGIGP